jgi:hypothetical protein
VFSVVQCSERPQCEEQEPFQNRLITGIRIFEENNGTLERTASDAVDSGQFSNTKTVYKKGKISMSAEGARSIRGGNDPQSFLYPCISIGGIGCVQLIASIIRD